MGWSRVAAWAGLLTLAVGAVACAGDTLESGNCGAGQQFSPVTGQCQVGAGGVRPEGTTGDTTGGTTGGGSTDGGSSGGGSTGGGTTDSGSLGASALRLDPERVVFDYTPARERREMEVILHNDASEPVTIAAVNFEGAAQEFSIAGLSAGMVLGPSSQLAFSVAFAPQDVADDRVGLLITPEVARIGAVRLDLSSRLVGAELCTQNCPRIQVDPVAISFSYQIGGGAVEQEFAIANIGDGPLTIGQAFVLQRGTEYALEGLTLPTVIDPGRSTFAKLRFTPGNPLNDAATIKLQSNDAWTPELDIPVTAITKSPEAEPCVTATPQSLDFGRVVRGSQARRTFAISNCGRLDVSITAMNRGTLLGFPITEAFEITQGGATPFTLRAGESRQVEVTFTPRRAGLYRGNYQIRTTAPSASTLRVNLNGTGEAPPLSEQDIHVQVDWNTGDTDVDTHFIQMPGGALFCPLDCNFSNAEPDWDVQGDWQDDPFLDRDVVSGYGPENVNLKRATDGKTYKVVLHYWRDSHNMSPSNHADATVKLFIRGALVQTWGPKRLNRTGDTWDVFEMAWPSRQITSFTTPIYQRASSTSCQ